MTGCREAMVLGATLLPLVTPACAAGFTLDDIEFWVGEGENRAGVAIDWNGDDLPLTNSAPSLAWGYRWDGEATAEDALRGLLAGDPRLFGKLAFVDGEPGARVLGLGYDTNDDGEFEVEADPLVEAFFQTDFIDEFDPITGLATTDDETYASSTDPADAYEEGFNNNPVNSDNQGFWHFGVALDGVAADWISAPVGVSSAGLIDELFLGFAFTPSFDVGPTGAFANNLIPAPPPTTGRPEGDFNSDGIVDAADFVALRDTSFDTAAYSAFVTNFGTGPTPTTALVTPEPPAFAMTCVLIAAIASVQSPRNHRPR